MFASSVSWMIVAYGKVSTDESRFFLSYSFVGSSQTFQLYDANTFILHSLQENLKSHATMNFSDAPNAFAHSIVFQTVTPPLAIDATKEHSHLQPPLRLSSLTLAIVLPPVLTQILLKFW